MKNEFYIIMKHENKKGSIGLYRDVVTDEYLVFVQLKDYVGFTNYKDDEKAYEAFKAGLDILK